MCLVSIFSSLRNLVGWSRVDARVTVGVESRGLGWGFGGGGESSLHLMVSGLSLVLCLWRGWLNTPFTSSCPNSSLSLHKCKPKHAVVVVYAKSPVVLEACRCRLHRRRRRLHRYVAFWLSV
ncbi:hypothetical protein VNO77_07704 [Canavalia gladiata]|uniref:Uncharacterized protein n=1 Tax=Canavalia gladiata TaxID=3824 RepID=A0AAN9M9E1_CANGL